MKTVKRLAAVVAALALTVGMSINCLAADTWGYYFGMNETLKSVWYEGAEGDLVAQTADSWTAELKSIGWGGCWGAQVFQNTEQGFGDVKIEKGKEYNLKCTLSSSNCDKWVYIKIAKGEDMAYGNWVYIKKGSSVTLDETFTAKANANSIYFGFGGENGDRSGADDDADIRYSYVPGGVETLQTKHDGNEKEFDPTLATTVKCTGFYLGEPAAAAPAEGNAEPATAPATTGTTTTVATGDFTPIACGAAAVIAAAVIVLFARKRETE